MSVSYYTIQAKHGERDAWSRFLNPSTGEFDERFDGRKHPMISKKSVDDLARKVADEHQIPLLVVARAGGGLPVAQYTIGTEYDPETETI